MKQQSWGDDKTKKRRRKNFTSLRSLWRANPHVMHNTPTGIDKRILPLTPLIVFSIWRYNGLGRHGHISRSWYVEVRSGACEYIAPDPKHIINATIPVESECWSQMTVLTTIVATLHMLPTTANDVADNMLRNKNDRKLIPRPATQESNIAITHPVLHLVWVSTLFSSSQM